MSQPTVVNQQAQRDHGRHLLRHLLSLSTGLGPSSGFQGFRSGVPQWDSVPVRQPVQTGPDWKPGSDGGRRRLSGDRHRPVRRPRGEAISSPGGVDASHLDVGPSYGVRGQESKQGQYAPTVGHDQMDRSAAAEPEPVPRQAARPAAGRRQRDPAAESAKCIASAECAAVETTEPVPGVPAASRQRHQPARRRPRGSDNRQWEAQSALSSAHHYGVMCRASGCRPG